jgi:hypothetical protein
MLFHGFNLVLAVHSVGVVARFALRQPGFDLRSHHVGSVLDKVTLGRFSLSTSVSSANFHSINCTAFIDYLIFFNGSSSPFRALSSDSVP